MTDDDFMYVCLNTQKDKTYLAWVEKHLLEAKMSDSESGFDIFIFMHGDKSIPGIHLKLSA